MAEIGDGPAHFVRSQRTRHGNLLHARRGKHRGARGDRRRGDALAMVRRVVGMRHAPGMHQLDKDAAAFRMGIALLTEELVADDVAAGRLVRILPQWHGKPVSVYALTETRL